MTVSAAPAPVWQPVARVAGIFDLAGPRADGWLVAAGSAKLYLLDPLGAVTPFAQGPDGYADDKGGEAYLTIVPRLPASANSGGACTWEQGDAFILRLHAPLGLTKVDIHGVKSAFASIPSITSLSGITFDTIGTFGYRLVVTAGVSGGKTEVAAVDCAGNVAVITRAAPAMEGGIEVAPTTFGAFGGMLVAPDENSGNIYAVGADGSSKRVVASGLPKGGDIGVEGVAFVPHGWNGNLYYSDRATAGNPHPGTDSVLMLDSATLGSAGVQAGDLLAVTEGGTTLIDVRCATTTCAVTPVVSTPTRAHGEGHLVFTNAPAAPSPSPTASSAPAAARTAGGPDLFVVAVVIVALVVLVVAAVLVLLDLRSRR